MNTTPDDEIEFALAAEASGSGQAHDFQVQSAATALDDATPRRGDTIESATLAELYMKQGHFTEAAKIWAGLLAKRPGDGRVLERLAECQRQMAATGGGGMSNAAHPAFESERTQVVATLERWLANARRMQQIA